MFLIIKDQVIYIAWSFLFLQRACVVCKREIVGKNLKLEGIKEFGDLSAPSILEYLAVLLREKVGRKKVLRMKIDKEIDFFRRGYCTVYP